MEAAVPDVQEFEWDPQLYQQFTAERDRPFADLTARVDAQAPRSVVDLGCGDGRLTTTLARRWPDARVTGVDGSAAMLADARAAGRDRQVELVHGDVRDWTGADLDVIVSNATLQWVPDHLDLLPRWIEALSPEGWLAVAVPGNTESPSHVLMRAVAERAPYAGHLDDRLGVRAVPDPAAYAAVMLAAGCRVDTWETTYVHALTGTDPVVTWVRGTGLRPILARLPAALREDYLGEYRARVAEAYPPVVGPYGPVTLLAFRRVFAVGRRVSGIRAA